MLQKFIALALGILFILIFSLPSLVKTTLALLGILVVAMVALRYWFYRNQIKLAQDSSFLLLPALWLAAAAAVSMLQGQVLLRYFILLPAALVFIKIQLMPPQQATGRFTENIWLVSSIGIFLGIWALDFYFTPAWWRIMALVFGSSLVLLWVGFAATPVSELEKMLYSLVLSLLLTEITWALLFWPLHFVSMAAVLTGFFYLAWIIPKFFLEGILTRKKIFFHITFIGLIEVIILSSAIWLPPS